jgi:hypothetical protein
MSGLARGIAAGVAAGAAGTTALNVVTYLDMAVRGRPASGAPQDAVAALLARAGVEVPGDEETRQNRLAGLGPLSGMIPGLGVGAAMGVARALDIKWLPAPVAGVAAAATAMATTDISMAELGVSDPHTWGMPEWLSDVVPHLVYGLVTAYTIRALDPH